MLSFAVIDGAFQMAKWMLEECFTVGEGEGLRCRPHWGPLQN